MNPPPDSSVEHGTDNFTLPWAAIAFLILTAALSLLWSHHKLLSQDEIFVLQTDSVPSYAQLIHIQRSYPISLDPLVYHTLAHIAIKIFGAGSLRTQDSLSVRLSSDAALPLLLRAAHCQ